MAEGKMLQVILFAVLLGLAMSKTGESGRRVLKVFEDLNLIVMKLVTMLIQLAPYGVFCLMVTLGVTVGWSEITKLLAYFLTVVAALLLHMMLVYPLFLRFIAGVNPLIYLKKMREPMLVAFSSASSGATLPVTLRTVEHRVGVSNSVCFFCRSPGSHNKHGWHGDYARRGNGGFIAQFYGFMLGPAGLLVGHSDRPR